MNIIPTVLGAKPGIQRDGTRYNSNHFTSGEGVRFYHGWAQKILGWTNVFGENNFVGDGEVIGSMMGVPRSRSWDVYLGRPASLNFFNLTNDGNIGPEISRTPLTLFVPDDENLWCMTLALVYPASPAAESIIIAQVAHNLNDITNETDGPVFFGPKNSNAPLTPMLDDGSPIYCSGGVIESSGNIVVYGNQGIRWCTTENITTWSPWQPIGNTKCCAAVNYQGSLLLWTLNGLYRAQYVGAESGLGTWSVQEISPNISIWSSKSILVYENIVYWLGKGQFYTFNGSVGNLYNTMNNNYFFDGFNRNFKAKAATFVDEKNQEIWFLYPRDDNSENSHAVMYYTESRVWNDTPMPRSLGLSLSTYDYRLMPSTKLYTSSSGGSFFETYPLFQHEYGYDDVFNGTSRPIKASITYPIKDFFSAQPTAENNICILSFRIEPDFILLGEMTVKLINRMYAQDAPEETPEYTFDQTTTYIDIKPTQGRLVGVNFTIDVLGGYFESGKTLHGINKGAAAA